MYPLFESYNMKNIYFVEAGFSFDNDIYLPYATGCIAAYMKKENCFNENYRLAGFIYRRESTDSIIEKIDAPYIVGFSCSIWNYNFNLALAKKVKEKYPECIIIFGGHNVTRNDNLLKSKPFVDVLVYGEGEKTFCSVVKAAENAAWKDICNISYRKNGVIFTTPEAAPDKLDDFPSPYTYGIFDGILEKENHSSLLCVLETNRGCPYSCSYCDWCSGKNVRLFPIEKVKSELDWFARNGLEYCFCADSNFGLFERDIEIAEYAAGRKEKYGYPKVFRTCFAKYSNDTVFKISSILNKAGMDKGATLAYQSLSETVLKNINRKNLTLEHFSELLKKYNKAGIPTYSELILGLPGETKKSFCEGICKILESGQHNSLSIYYLEMLPNSQMSEKSYIAKHKLETIEIGFNHMHSTKKNTDNEEFSHIVQSTATLSKEDWIYCNLFSICVQTFHFLGFLRFVALFLVNEKNVSYFDFYSSLLDFIMNAKGTLLNKVFCSFKEKLSSSLAGDWNFTDSDFGEAAWAFEEGAYLTFLKNSRLVREEMSDFIKSFFSDAAIYEEVIGFQDAILRSCNKEDKEYSFSYDFLEYFTRLQNGQSARLDKHSVRYIFKAEKNYTDWKEFAKEIVWFGRRRGDTLYSDKQNAKASIEKYL